MGRVDQHLPELLDVRWMTQGREGLPVKKLKNLRLARPHAEQE
jgi:hypothetical protein